MSHFTTIKTRITDPEILRQALLACCGWDSIYEKNGAPLYGYKGDDRSLLDAADPNYAPLCEVVVNRRQVGDAANDIGFYRTADGTFAAVVSEFDKRYNFSEETFKKLSVEYSRQATLSKAKAMGFDVVETRENNQLQLRFVPKKRQRLFA